LTDDGETLAAVIVADCEGDRVAKNCSYLLHYEDPEYKLLNVNFSRFCGEKMTLPGAQRSQDCRSTNRSKQTKGKPVTRRKLLILRKIGAF
jgi:hypothetical protein